MEEGGLLRGRCTPPPHWAVSVSPISNQVRTLKPGMFSCLVVLACVLEVRSNRSRIWSVLILRERVSGLTNNSSYHYSDDNVATMPCHASNCPFLGRGACAIKTAKGGNSEEPGTRNGRSVGDRGLIGKAPSHLRTQCGGMRLQGTLARPEMLGTCT